MSMQSGVPWIGPGADQQTLDVGARNAAAGSGSTGQVLWKITEQQTPVVNSTTETALLSYTIPANSVTTGTVYQWFLGGTTDNIATSGTLVLRWRLGGLAGVVLATHTLATQGSAGTNSSWIAQGQLMFRGAPTATTPFAHNSFLRAAWGGTVTGAVQMAPGNVAAQDMTTSKALILSAQFQTAATGNAIRLETGTLTQS